jgi:electron transfer flavoprotein beta subunit
MKIAACVKAVPDAPEKRIDPATFRLDRSGDTALNLADRHVVEAALQLRGGDGETEVVAVSLGPPEALAALRSALAIGADRGVLISDEAAAGSDLLGTARALAAALERERPDLVLLGQQAGDSNGALLWAALADRLHLPVISRALSLTVAGRTLVVRRRGDTGLDTIEAPLPCVAAVSTAINEPHLPTFRELKRALEKPYEVLSLADLGVSPAHVGDAGQRTSVVALAAPAARGEALRIVDQGEAARELLEFLLERKLVL